MDWRRLIIQAYHFRSTDRAYAQPRNSTRHRSPGARVASFPKSEANQCNRSCDQPPCDGAKSEIFPRIIRGVILWSFYFDSDWLLSRRIADYRIITYPSMDELRAISEILLDNVIIMIVHCRPRDLTFLRNLGSCYFRVLGKMGPDALLQAILLKAQQ